MRKVLLALFLTSVLAGVSAADEGRYQVVQGSMANEPGKTPSQVPVVIKVDVVSGETWRLLVSSGGYWWLPIKTGVLKSAAAPAPADKPAEGADAAPKKTEEAPR